MKSIYLSQPFDTPHHQWRGLLRVVTLSGAFIPALKSSAWAPSKSQLSAYRRWAGALFLALSIAGPSGCDWRRQKEPPPPPPTERPIVKEVKLPPVPNTQAQLYLSYQPDCRKSGLLSKSECQQCAKIPD